MCQSAAKRSGSDRAEAIGRHAAHHCDRCARSTVLQSGAGGAGHTARHSTPGEWSSSGAHTALAGAQLRSDAALLRGGDRIRSIATIPHMLRAPQRPITAILMESAGCDGGHSGGSSGASGAASGLRSAVRCCSYCCSSDCSRAPLPPLALARCSPCFTTAAAVPLFPE